MKVDVLAGDLGMSVSEETDLDVDYLEERFDCN